MSDPTDQWTRAPIAEVVAGLRFEQIEGFTNGHLGRFWHELKDRYPHSRDAMPVELADFEELPTPQLPGLKMTAHSDLRLQILSEDEARMVQIQNGWILCNWLRVDGDNAPEYVGFSGLLEEFLDVLPRFQRFLESVGLRRAKPMLWEVTYVDHIFQGTVWNDRTELPQVFPGLLGSSDAPDVAPESFNSSVSFRRSSPPATVRIHLQMARLFADPSAGLAIVNTRARGPVHERDETQLEETLRAGKRLACSVFESVSSREALDYWKG